jgi:hypothetical protein
MPSHAFHICNLMVMEMLYKKFAFIRETIIVKDTMMSELISFVTLHWKITMIQSFKIKHKQDLAAFSESI